jgi:hypothetical protein
MSKSMCIALILILTTGATNAEVPALSVPGQQMAAVKAPTAEDFKKSDFGALDAAMQAGVPADIRSKALQKLWLSDPLFTRMDEFHDSHIDYAQPALAGR